MSDEIIKTDKERIADLENDLTDAIELMSNVERDFKNMFGVMQDLFGIRFIKDGDHVRCAILSPTKQMPRPGIIADMHHKLEILWKKNGESRIIMP